jgi:hypothetical protein
MQLKIAVEIVCKCNANHPYDEPVCYETNSRRYKQHEMLKGLNTPRTLQFKKFAEQIYLP